MKYLALTLILITNLAWGQQSCPQNVTKVTKGLIVPCDGYIFSPETELEARIAVSTKNKLDDYIKIQNDMLSIQSQRIDNFVKQNAALEQKIDLNEKTNFLRATVYFGLGVLVTGFIVHNVK